MDKQNNTTETFKFKEGFSFSKDSSCTQVTMPLDVFENIKQKAELNDTMIEKLCGVSKYENYRLNIELLHKTQDNNRLKSELEATKMRNKRLESEKKYSPSDILFAIILYILAIIGVISILRFFFS